MELFVTVTAIEKQKDEKLLINKDSRDKISPLPTLLIKSQKMDDRELDATKPLDDPDGVHI